MIQKPLAAHCAVMRPLVVAATAVYYAGPPQLRGSREYVSVTIGNGGAVRNRQLKLRFCERNKHYFGVWCSARIADITSAITGRDACHGRAVSGLLRFQRVGAAHYF